MKNSFTRANHDIILCTNQQQVMLNNLNGG